LRPGSFGCLTFCTPLPLQAGQITSFKTSRGFFTAINHGGTWSATAQTFVPLGQRGAIRQLESHPTIIAIFRGLDGKTESHFARAIGKLKLMLAN
jgi:hypothetical protein